MSGVADLARFRADKEKKGRPWQFQSLKPRLGKRVLVFDQALAATGWVAMEASGSLIGFGTIRTQSDYTSHEQSLRRAVMVFEEVRSILGRLNVQPGHWIVAHEQPPLDKQGTKMSRPESSLLAAAAVRIAVSMRGLEVRMYQARAAKKRMTGNPNADKVLVREQILKHVAFDGRTNEHVIDATAIAWLALEDEA